MLINNLKTLSKFLSVVTFIVILVNSNFDYTNQTARGQDQEEISPFVKDKSVLERPTDDMLVDEKEESTEEISPFVKDKSVLERPTDDMVITNEPPVDEDYVESGDAYLTISTIFKGRDDNNYRYIQNVQVCVGSELTVSKKEISAVPSCANHNEDGIKYTVQAPGKTFVYLSYLLENYAMDLRSSSCEFNILPGESQTCTLSVTLKPLPFK
jgi:hypothetical protein